MSALRLPLTLALLCLFIPIVGCAPHTAMPKINAEYYPQCYAPFKQLHDAEVSLRNRTVGYTAGGAIAGAAGGALLGFLLSGGKWEYALAGGVAGGLSGAATGYTMAKLQGIKDDQKRLLAYKRSMDIDMANATEVELAALQSLKCYIQEFEQLQKGLAEQTVTREEYAKRYVEIRTGITELGKITGDSQLLLAQRDAEFRTALQAEATQQNTSLKPLPTVDERRAQHLKQQKKTAAKVRKHPKQKRGKSAAQPEASASLAIADLKNEIQALEEQAQNDRQRYQPQKETPAQPAATAVEPTPATPKATPAVLPVSVDQVAETYDAYPTKVLQMEAVERQRQRTLEIMSDAAAKTGIDMV